MDNSTYARSAVLVLLMSLPGLAAEAPRIDGVPNEAFWSQLPSGRLVPVASGFPAGMDGEVRSGRDSRFLYVAVTLPEPTGRFTARSIGRNPRWEEEDYVTVRTSGDSISADWVLKVGPLGGYTIERKGMPVNKPTFLVASQRGTNQWTAEFAVPIFELGTLATSKLGVSVERVRAARPGLPELQYRWPVNAPTASITELASPLDPPQLRPVRLGNTEAALEVGKSAANPDSDWDGAVWKQVPVWTLQIDQPVPVAPRFATEVKALQTGTSLILLARCYQPNQPVAKEKVRDGAVMQDDSLQVYLATSGSTYAQFAVNALGTVLDAAGWTGGQYITRPRMDWNSPVRGWAKSADGHWMARLDIPLREAALVLGEETVPQQWKILLMRVRNSSSGVSGETAVLPVIQSTTPYCPLRYRAVEFVSRNASAPKPAVLPALPGLPPVLAGSGRGMLERQMRERMAKVVARERDEFAGISTAAAWERFRDPRIKALAASIGDLPPSTAPAVRVSKQYEGQGYRREDLVYESRPGLWVTANLFLPEKVTAPVPGMAIVHSHHRPRTQAELQDMGILWARSGAAVLIMDQMGAGERLQNHPWNREAYHSRYVMGMQLHLIGESLMQWMVSDIRKGIDLLVNRKEVDPKRIALLGAVAGGGDPAAVAAALDSRIAVVVPFNFGEATPESPRFTDGGRWTRDVADPGWGSWETTRNLRRNVADGFLPWVICASVAPRKFIYSYEMGWNVEEMPAWARYQKVFGFYNALENLSEAHGFGPFPGPGECTNIGPAQRKTFYGALERWLGLPPPAKEPDDRRPESELQALTPELAAQLRMAPVHRLARDRATKRLAAAKGDLAKVPAPGRRVWLQERLEAKLGDIRPGGTDAVSKWSQNWNGASAEGLVLTVEAGIEVPMILLRPPQASAKTPVVVAVGEGGKGQFLVHRQAEIRSLIEAGFSVCLVDVRGTGETSPDTRRGPSSNGIALAATEQMLGGTLLGARLKDLRSVIGWLSRNPGIQADRIALWGDSFAPANPARIEMDELLNWQVGPGIKYQAEPLGALLALLGGLYEDRVRAIVGRGGLTTFRSLLDDSFTYLPSDIIVPGFLECGDLDTIAEHLHARSLFVESVDAKNRPVRRQTENVRLAEWLKANL